MNPDLWGWDRTNQLLASAVDAINLGNWQRGGDEHAPRPKPISRPGVESDDLRFGKGALSIEDMDEWLGWNPPSHN